MSHDNPNGLKDLHSYQMLWAYSTTKKQSNNKIHTVSISTCCHGMYASNQYYVGLNKFQFGTWENTQGA